ncbi:MAG: ABC transporter permease [Firmicutes bacterium]|nr:ABC transporter permease [Bacillota bacterium]
MLIYCLKQTGRMVLLLVAVSILSFALISVSPIDPLQANVGEAALAGMSQAQIEKLEEYWGVNTPPVERYMNWAQDAVCGDFGTSLLYRRPVMEVVFEKFSNSAIVLVFAWVFSGVLGFALGILAGVNRGKLIDRVINGATLVIASTPAFWLALVFLMFFSVYLGILPVGLSVPIGSLASEVTFGDKVIHAILPALTLSVTGIANITLHTREKMIDVMESDYVLFAKARGESTFSTVKNHGIRNIILPAMTLQFASVSEIFGGSVLVEEVFSYPGLGQAAVNAGLGADVPLLLGITLIMAGIVFAGNMVANILYGVVDPRIRRGGERR